MFGYSTIRANSRTQIIMTGIIRGDIIAVHGPKKNTKYINSYVDICSRSTTVVPFPFHGCVTLLSKRTLDVLWELVQTVNENQCGVTTHPSGR